MRRMRNRKRQNNHHPDGVMWVERKAATHYYPARLREESSEQEIGREHGREAAQQRVRHQRLVLTDKPPVPDQK